MYVSADDTVGSAALGFLDYCFFEPVDIYAGVLNFLFGESGEGPVFPSKNATVPVYDSIKHQ